MSSMTSSLYISEASPARIRGALVSTNGFLITGGQFLSYLINLAFTKAPGTWRWMPGVAGVPSVVQFGLMWSLPESPRWLYRKNKVDEARAILEKIYPANEVEDEMKALHESVEMEKAEEGDVGDGVIAKLKGAFSNPPCGPTKTLRRHNSPSSSAICGYQHCHVLQPNHCSVGRRRLMIISMVGIITCLVVLPVVFFQAAAHAPRIGNLESTHFGSNSTCPAYVSAPNPASWNCMTCLKAQCGFCANCVSAYAPGACVASKACAGEHRVWYTKGCPSKVGFFVVILLGLYIIIYALGMGTIPWIVNSEIYPLRFRGTCGGIAAVTNWSANLIVSKTCIFNPHSCFGFWRHVPPLCWVFSHWTRIHFLPGS